MRKIVRKLCNLLIFSVLCGAGKSMKPYIDISEDAKKDAITLMEAAPV